MPRQLKCGPRKCHLDVVHPLTNSSDYSSSSLEQEHTGTTVLDSSTKRRKCRVNNLDINSDHILPAITTLDVHVHFIGTPTIICPFCS